VLIITKSAFMLILGRGRCRTVGFCVSEVRLVFSRYEVLVLFVIKMFLRICVGYCWFNIQLV
jgi:hypothetical protein